MSDPITVTKVSHWAQVNLRDGVPCCPCHDEPMTQVDDDEWRCELGLAGAVPAWADGRPPRPAGAQPVNEWCRECRDEDKTTPADFILWGKLFPPEALGPRCYDHAAKHLGWSAMQRLDQYAVYDLRSDVQNDPEQRGDARGFAQGIAFANARRSHADRDPDPQEGP